MSADWLQTYLLDAVRRGLCTKIHCTTCGALEFRRGVLKRFAEANGVPARQHYDFRLAGEVATTLADVTPMVRESPDLEPAIRCLLFDLWSSNREIAASLDGSWPGDILTRMKQHHEDREAARRAREQFEREAPIRREENKRLKQRQHQERFARKKERDWLWRESGGVNPSLWNAYSTTVFCAEVDGLEVRIRPGHGAPSLDSILQKRGLTTWAFVTAWNPGSRLLSSQENAERHLRLQQDLRVLGYDMFPGEGEPADSRWTAEHSLLILGISEAQAVSLGQQYGQAAIVLGEIGGPARLKSCKPPAQEDADT